MRASFYWSQIDKNYNTAAVFYEERKNMFLNLYQQRTKQNFEHTRQQGIASFIKQWKSYEERMIASIQNKNYQGIQYFSFSHNGKTEKLRTGLTPQFFLENPNMSASEIKKRFATPFELVLKEYFNRDLQHMQRGIDNFIMQHTGQIVQKGFTFKGERAIRSDIAFTTGRAIPNHMELSTGFDTMIQKYSTVYNDQARLNNSVVTLLRNKYLNPNNFAAGFSIKNYSESISYTSSKNIQDEVNLLIRYQTRADEADVSMKYVLSKHVIAITSPTVLGLITTKGFTWMSDLLRMKRYIMHLRRDDKTKRFWVENPNIYFQDNNKTSGVYSNWSGSTYLGLEPFEFAVDKKLTYY